MSTFVLLFRPPSRNPETSALIEGVQLFPHREIVPGTHWIDTTFGRSREEVVAFFSSLQTGANAEWCIGEVVRSAEHPEDWLLNPGGYYPEAKIVTPRMQETNQIILRVLAICRLRKSATKTLERHLSDIRILRQDIVPGACFVNPKHDPEDILHDLGDEFRSEATGIVVCQLKIFRWQSNFWLDTIYHN